jgi:hypothetical protein
MARVLGWERAATAFERHAKSTGDSTCALAVSPVLPGIAWHRVSAVDP